MAETAVNIVIDKLIPLIAEEAKLLSGIHKEVKCIKDELEIIAAFLKEADAREARGETNHLIKAWVKQVVDVAFRMEDVIDEYLHHVAQHQQTPQRHRKRMWFISFIRKISRSIMKLKPRHELASEIQDIKENVRDIKNRGNGYVLINSTPQVTSSTSGMHNQPPISSLFVDEAELFGIEAPKYKLLSWFEEEQADRMVFSLVGMGGVGKTTLAKKVFDSQKGRFDCHAWVTVSQTYSMKELLKSMIHQFHQACKESAPAGVLDNMDEVMLINHLHEYVHQKRYVVAFDDIWSVEFWMAMKYALPDNKNCSRILITTRNENVAPSFIASSLNCVYLLQPLPFEEAWKLFCKKVFQSLNNETHDCPTDLEELSKSMVRRCEGLPLAISAIGGILSIKQKNVFEWKSFHDSLATKLENNENLASVTKVLSLSYHDLPYHLKPCLLYFGMYPEDYSIRGSRLIRQWIAEGFVKTTGQKIIEDVAEGYLMELVRRNLIQVTEDDYSRKSRAFRVHDLIRDFIHSKSKQLRFGQFFTKDVSSNLGDQGRRISILSCARDVFEENVNIPPVRSVFMFQTLEFPNNFIITLFEKFKLLNMLDFEDAPMTFLPDEIENLFHLKYLSIRNTKVECLPKSIGKLQQLETLDMKWSLVRELPIEIKRLHKLRHLLVYSYDFSIVDLSLTTVKGVTIEGGLGCTETLQKLSYVEADGSNGVIKELRNFKQLRKLGITKVSRADGTDLCNAIENMDELRSLDITAKNENEVMDLQSLVSPPPLLQRLILNGKLEMMPIWISKLHNVVRVNLRWSGLADNPLQALEELPNLMSLEICRDAYIGEQLHFQRGGFEKLKVLKLLYLNALEKLTIDEGALSNLEKLDIGPSPLLKEVPSGIQYVSKLKEVCFSDMPREFCMSMALAEGEEEEGPNHKLIRHIPNAYVAIKCGPRQHNYYRLK